MESEYEEQADTLSLLLASSMGWLNGGSQWDTKVAQVRSCVDTLGVHGVRQALTLVQAHPDAAIKEATYLFISENKTDNLAFLGVERWAHHSILKTVRTLDGARYQCKDFLQAPGHVLSEARTLADITNLCLSGELSHGVDNTRESWENGKLEYTLNNDELVKLVQRRPDMGDEIINTMRLRNTFDVALIEQVITTTMPLVNGVL